MSPRTSLMVGAAAIGALLATLIFLVAATGTPSRYESVSASQMFLLRDEDGRVRGEWSTKVDGAPKLWFYDERGSRRMELSLLSDGSAGLRLLDSREQIRASLGVTDGEPLLTLRDQDGHERVRVILLAGGEPSLLLWDDDGNAVWSAPDRVAGSVRR